MSDPVRIVIGTERNQFVTQQVLQYSIRKSTSRELDIRCVTQQEERVGGTNFGFVRFHAPRIFGYEGRAIYMDADQLVLTDIAGLLDSLDSQHDIALVKNAEGTFGGKPVAQCNQSSVMVLNCEKLRDWEVETMFEKVVPNRTICQEGQIEYREFMKLEWMDQGRIMELDSRWNHFNIIRDDTNLVHFSHVRSQPWKNPDHPLTELWTRWLVDAMKVGFVKRYELWREVYKGHLHRRFLRHTLPI